MPFYKEGMLPPPQTLQQAYQNALTRIQQYGNQWTQYGDTMRGLTGIMDKWSRGQATPEERGHVVNTAIQNMSVPAPIAYHGTPHTWESPSVPLYAVRTPGGPFSGGILTDLTKAEAETYAAKSGGQIMTHAQLNALNKTSKRKVPELPLARGGIGEMRPDISKVGTGQGAQSYGHGLYFAESPAVAKTYQKMGEQGIAGLDPQKYGMSGDEAAKIARGWLEYKDINPGEMHLFKVANPTKGTDKLLNDVISGVIKKSEGSFYQVNIPDEQVAKMLDWDKPLIEQPEILKKVGMTKDQLWEFGHSNPTGETLYKHLTRNQTGGSGVDTWAAASAQLKAAGIPGIKYLDQGSRQYSLEQTQGGFGDWIVKNINNQIVWKGKDRVAAQAAMDKLSTRNFVVFDPEIVKDVVKQ